MTLDCRYSTQTPPELPRVNPVDPATHGGAQMWRISPNALIIGPVVVFFLGVRYQVREDLLVYLSV
jgi:hypothetical protein